VKYGDDADQVEQLLLESARRHALTSQKIGEKEVKRLENDFGVTVGDVDPRVYWRMTDNWLELTIRFLLPDHGGRGIKDAMSREILDGLYRSKIEIASGTYAIVEVPPIRVEGLSPAR